MAAAESLTDLPEIGPVTARRLTEVGVPDPATLRSVGAIEAFKRIRTHLDPDACIQEFTGIECAVQGIRARELTPEQREDIREQFRKFDSVTAV
jgi:DNA transformation protein